MRHVGLKHGRRGYSLAELILGAAVVAGFVVRIYQSYAATSESDKFTKLVDEINLVVGTSTSVFEQTLNFGSFSTELIKGAIPRGYVDESTSPATIKTPYQQPIAFSPVLTSNGVNGGLSLQFSIPRDVCQRLTIGGGFDYVSVDTGATLQSPVGGANAVLACAGTTTDALVTLTYTGGQGLATAPSPAPSPAPAPTTTAPQPTP